MKRKSEGEVPGEGDEMEIHEIAMSQEEDFVCCEWAMDDMSG